MRAKRLKSKKLNKTCFSRAIDQGQRPTPLLPQHNRNTSWTWRGQRVLSITLSMSMTQLGRPRVTLRMTSLAWWESGSRAMHQGDPLESFFSGLQDPEGPLKQRLSQRNSVLFIYALVQSSRMRSARTVMSRRSSNCASMKAEWFLINKFCLWSKPESSRPIAKSTDGS